MSEISQPSSTTIKFCALCDFWSGPRATNHQNTLVRYDTSSVGICYGGMGCPSNQQNKRAQDHCSKFMKWSILR